MEHQTQYNLRIAPTPNHQRYQTLDIQCEEEHQLAWYFMHAQPRQCCTPTLIHEIQHWFHELKYSPKYEDIRYIVLASGVPEVFNLGGDLNLFTQLIRANDREGLQQYATDCIDTLMLNHSGADCDITTISLVQGDALGGGMEYAISSHVLIAERSAKLGMPEILFNLFPGMGAFSLLSRKVGAKLAEKIILGGRLYSAEELYELGVVDVLAEDGQGESAVYDYIHQEEKSRNGIRAFRAASKCTNPVTYQELSDVTKIWVDAALRLRDKDLRMMERLVKRQSAKTA